VPLASSAAPRRASRPEITSASGDAAPGAPSSGPLRREDDADPPRFEEVYGEHFSFVWRSVRRLGVNPSAVDDVVQEIFLVVHRRMTEFEGRASMKTWLFGIVLRVVRQHRRTLRRKPAQLGGMAAVDLDVDGVHDAAERGPHEHAAEREAVRTLHAILDELDDEKREVLVLADLEEMTVPEIAEAVETNVNTVYSRLRAARRDFDLAIVRHRARDQWRER
jgi:RNA polymerase sigma-70 factor (ECF subfamily)